MNCYKLQFVGKKKSDEPNDNGTSTIMDLDDDSNESMTHIVNDMINSDKWFGDRVHIYVAQHTVTGLNQKEYKVLLFVHRFFDQFRENLTRAGCGLTSLFMSKWKANNDNGTMLRDKILQNLAKITNDRDNTKK